MATFHVDISHKGKNPKAPHSTNRATYIQRTGRYGKLEDLVASGEVRIPYWAKNATEFFDAANQYERANGNIFIQAIISLPCELNHEQNIELAEKINEEFFGEHSVGAWAIHSKPAATMDVEQIHYHGIRSERIVTDEAENVKPPELFFRRYNPAHPEKGGYQKDVTFCNNIHQTSKAVKDFREKVAELINEAYEKAGLEEQVSAKSLKEQYQDACEEGDNEKAKLLNREPLKRVPFKQYMKTIKLLRLNKILEDNNPENIFKSTVEKFNQIFSDAEDYTQQQALLQFGTKIVNQMEKLRYIKQKQQKLPVTMQDIEEILYDKKARIEARLESNITYATIYKSIYDSKNTIVNFVQDCITKNKTKKYRKKRKEAATLKAKIEKARRNVNFPTAKIAPLEEKYKLLEAQVSKLKNECEAIIAKPENMKYAEKIYQRLKEKFPGREAQLKHRSEENVILADCSKSFADVTTLLSKMEAVPENIRQLAAKLKEQTEPKEIKMVLQEIKKQLGQSQQNKNYETNKESRKYNDKSKDNNVLS